MVSKRQKTREGSQILSGMRALDGGKEQAASEYGSNDQSSRRWRSKLKEADFKPSLADFLRLVQLEKEIGEEEPKEIKVTWVEPDKSSTET